MPPACEGPETCAFRIHLRDIGALDLEYRSQTADKGGEKILACLCHDPFDHLP